jgi:hypothetical protein
MWRLMVIVGWFRAYGRTGTVVIPQFSILWVKQKRLMMILSIMMMLPTKMMMTLFIG